MKVLVLGPVVVADGDGTMTRLGPRETILLAVLAAHFGRRVAIDTLIDAMWAGAPPRTALKTLHGHVHRLRKVLGAGAIQQMHGGYVLAELELTLDSGDVGDLVAQAGEWARRGDPDKSVVLLREALTLFRGEPFEGIDVDAVLAEAQRLAEVRLETYEATFDSELAAARHREVVGELQAYAAAHPLREHASAQLMIALYRCGRQAEALATYHRARTHLAVELGLEPGPELRSVEEAVLSHNPSLDLPRQAASHASRVSYRRTRFDASDLDSEATTGFVGRESEVARCDGALRGTAERSLITITGPPGVGKTRLAAVVTARARQAGWTVVDVSCHEDLAHPYGLVADVVRSVFSLNGEGGAELSAMVRMRIARLAPELVPDVAVTAPLNDVDRDADRASIVDAVDQILTAALDEPLLVVVDDLQWADSQSLAVLQHLVRSRQGSRFAVLATCRDLLDNAPAELLELFAGADRAGRHQRVALAALNVEELEVLVRVTTGRADAALARALNAKTDGNPLLAHALLRASADDTGADFDTLLPLSIAELAAAKVKRLPPIARDVIDVAALIGREFSLSTVGDVLENRDLVTIVEPLLETGIVVEAKSDDNDLAFAHDLYREAVAQHRSLPWRRRIHGRLAAVLPRSDELLDSVCYHARLAGDPFVIVDVLLLRARRRAGRLLVDESLDDTADALRYLQRCEPEPAGLRADILELTGDTLALCGRRDEACASYTAARESTALDRWQLARLHRKEAKCHRLSRQLDEAIRSITAAHELGGDSPPADQVACDIWIDVELEIGWFDFSSWHELPWAQGRLEQKIDVIEPRIQANQRVNLLHCRSLTAAKTNRWRSDATASSLADRALQLAHTHGDPAQLAEANFGVGFLALWQGDLGTATSSIDEALRLFRVSGDRNWETLSLLYLAIAARLGSDRAGTGALLDQLTSSALSSVAPMYGSAATATRAWCAFRDGEFGEAEALASQALAGWQSPYDRLYSFQGLAAWPALAMAVTRGDTDKVIALSALLVHSAQLALPDEIAGPLSQAVRLADPSAAQSVLPWARDHGWI